MNKELSFKQKTKVLKQFSKEWFLEYPLLSDPWVLEFNKLKGSCEGQYDCYTKTITLDIDMVNKYELHTFKDILLHEIAHALHFLMLIGTRQLFGHDKTFREICKAIGCKSYKAKNNTYILNMYGTYDITPLQEIAAMEAWYKEGSDIKIVCKIANELIICTNTF
jgi:predicted SprT family Zn-dependent metalloprotease